MSRWFVGCEDVPLRWRLAVTLAIYLFPRQGELRVLEWQDGAIDLEHGTIHIHRAWDRRAREATSTKSGRVRRFNIEPALLPLLRERFNRAGSKGPVLDLVSEAEMAVGLRRRLRSTQPFTTRSIPHSAVGVDDEPPCIRAPPRANQRTSLPLGFTATCVAASPGKVRTPWTRPRTRCTVARFT
jgi:integrase